MSFPKVVIAAMLWVVCSALLLVTSPGCGMAYLREEAIEKNSAFQGLSGRLVDSESGDGVANAKVTIKIAGDNDVRPFYLYSTGDGSFQLSSYKKGGVSTPLEPGTEYQLTISSVQHRIKDFKVMFDGGAQRLGAIELSRIEEGGAVLVVIPGVREVTADEEVMLRPRMAPPIP